MDTVAKPLELSPTTINMFELIVNNNDTSDSNVINDNNKLQLFPYLASTNKKQIFYKVQQNQKHPINFTNLEWLIETTKNNQDLEMSHVNFMENYSKIFAKDVKKQAESQSPRVNVFDRLYSLSKQDTTKKSLSHNLNENETIAKKESFMDKNSERIVEKLNKIKNRRSSLDELNHEKTMALRKLRSLVKKYPFERTDNENKQICHILKRFDAFLELLPPELKGDEKFLLEFASCAHFESVSSKFSQVFGSFAFHMILRGSVRPLSMPHLNKHSMKLRSVTPEPSEHEYQTLHIGDCFGTITELAGRELATRMFRVLTLEDKCEFLKLSVESYKKISKKILEEEKNEKLNAIKSCPGYESWPKHSLEDLIQFFEWRNFASNTILTNEGFLVPFIGFIDDGECHVLRKIDRDGDAGHRHVKQVVVGKLTKRQSFGEISVLVREPMTCTLVTETPCRIGIITYEKAQRLDDITQRLIMQCARRTFGELTIKEIHQKYIETEKKKLWTEYKNLIVEDTLKKYNITPGHGKYEIPKIDTRFNNTNTI